MRHMAWQCTTCFRASQCGWSRRTKHSKSSSFPRLRYVGEWNLTNHVQHHPQPLWRWVFAHLFLPRLFGALGLFRAWQSLSRSAGSRHSSFKSSNPVVFADFSTFGDDNQIPQPAMDNQKTQQQNKCRSHFLLEKFLNSIKRVLSEERFCCSWESWRVRRCFDMIRKMIEQKRGVIGYWRLDFLRICMFSVHITWIPKAWVKVMS